MTPDEYRELVAEHGSAAAAAVANPDRHTEIRAAFMRDEYEGMDRSFASSGGEVFAAYMPKSRKWFDDKVDQLQQAAQQARRQAEKDELRRLQLERLRHEPAADVPTTERESTPERVAPGTERFPS